MSRRQFQDIIYEKQGHKAQITINRPEVLNAFRQQTYVEFCLACADASADSQIGVLVITGHNSEENMQQALAAGADAYLTKPFAMKTLQKTLRELWTEVGRGKSSRP